MPQRHSPYSQMRKTPQGGNSYFYKWTSEQTGMPVQAYIPGLHVSRNYREFVLEHSVTGVIESCGRRRLRYLIFQADELLFTGCTVIYGSIDLALEAAQTSVEKWHTDHFREIKIVTEEMFADEDLADQRTRAQAEAALAYAFERRYASAKQQLLKGY